LNLQVLYGPIEDEKLKFCVLEDVTYTYLPGGSHISDTL